MIFLFFLNFSAKGITTFENLAYDFFKKLNDFLKKVVRQILTGALLLFSDVSLLCFLYAHFGHYFGKEWKKYARKFVYIQNISYFCNPFLDIYTNYEN